MKKNLFFLPLVAFIIGGFTNYSPPTHIASHPPGTEKGETNIIYFTNNGVKSPILLLNNTGLAFSAGTKLGIHLALLPFNDKYIPMAYDIVAWEDHENAEHYVMKFAKQNGLSELPIEQYTPEFIAKAETYCSNDSKLGKVEREKNLLVIRQTREYMKTEYFAKIYMDGKRVKTPQEVADWVTENTFVPVELILGKASDKTRQLSAQ